MKAYEEKNNCFYIQNFDLLSKLIEERFIVNTKWISNRLIKIYKEKPPLICEVLCFVL